MITQIDDVLSTTSSITETDSCYCNCNIFFTEAAQLPECNNHTAVEFIDQNQTQWQIIIIISALMNGLLLLLLIGELIFLF